MLMQSRTFPWPKIAQKEGKGGTVWLALELDGGDCAFAPIATTQDAEHSLSSRRRFLSCTLLGARPEVAAEPA